MIDIPWDLIGRTILAAFLGGMIGLERLWHGHEAGIRTNMIIAMSSCLFTILSTKGFESTSAGYDPTRVAAQIVTGVGFLGAGAILHDKNRTLGFTTAASIWLVAAIGMAVGTGMYALALIVTFIALVALFILSPLSDYLKKSTTKHRRWSSWFKDDEHD
jgi:putative Mg2+ transporter-C (MgtC) family protein